MKYIPKIGRYLLFGFFSLAILSVLFLCSLHIRPEWMLKSVSITQDIVSIENQYNSPSNSFQNQAKVILGTSDGKLYFCTNRIAGQFDRTKYYKYISVFDNGSAERLKQVDWFIGFSGEYAYYLSAKSGTEYNLFCYHLSTGVTTFLATVMGNAQSKSFFMNDIFYVPTDQTAVDYYVISGSCVQGVKEITKAYQLDSAEFAIVEDEYRLQCDNDIVSSVSIGIEASIIPCEYGLLIHNSYGGNQILYLIEKGSGRIVDLFSYTCVGSESAVAIYKDAVYLSVVCYEKVGDLSLVDPQSVSLQGTYRISLTNYTSEKLSEHIYNGMYIFDDTGIYVIDDKCHIYKVDFEGNLIMTLLE